MTTQREAIVAIIGGGFTGAAIAYHLDRLSAGAPRPQIIVIEPRESIGAGLAYSTAEAAHRVNVPSLRMSLDPNDPGQFDTWLAANAAVADDPASQLADGRIFPRRAVFARYVSDMLRPAVEARRIIHRQAKVQSVLPTASGFMLQLSDGASLAADLVVVATTHPPPLAPAAFENALAGDDRYHPDPSEPDMLSSIGSDDRVMIVGSGLTMADIVAALHRRGHRGKITVFSRRGQLPAQHPTHPPMPLGDFLAVPAKTTRQLVRRIRLLVHEAEARSLPWQSVFDTLRLQGRGIWQALPLAERHRLVRHLRVFWDSRRFRIAPQIHSVIAQKQAHGQLEVISGSAQSVRGDKDGITVGIRLRKIAGVIHCQADRVVIATGPGHQNIIEAEPYLAGLARLGLVRADTFRLGLDTDEKGQAIGCNGIAIGNLLIGGPLARGTFGELMGLPEVSRYAFDVAREIAAWNGSWQFYRTAEPARRRA